MSAPRSDRRPAPRALFWLLGGGMLLVTLAVLLRIFGAAADRGRVVGDGVDAATYGFDLADYALPREALAATGLPRDGLAALVSPPLVRAAGADSITASMRGKYLVSDDRVIGLVVNGAARAWPLRMLDWHEVANDTLGGRPVLVTWSPLTGSARAFDRSVDGETLEFAHSGLVADSSLLMYARGDTLSLWSQLAGRAVSGPAAAAERVLRELPLTVCDWSAWRARHPDTTLPLPAPEFRKRYGSDPYFTYRHGSTLRYPASVPVPDAPLQPLLAVSGPAGTELIDAAAVAAAAGEGGVLTLPTANGELRLRVGMTRGVGVPAVWLDDAASRDDLLVRPLDRFAARAFGLGDLEVRP